MPHFLTFKSEIEHIGDTKIRRLYEGKVKSSSLAYNLRETRSGQGWCHLHTSVKLFLVAVHSYMDIGDSIPGETAIR